MTSQIIPFPVSQPPDAFVVKSNSIDTTSREGSQEGAECASQNYCLQVASKQSERALILSPLKLSLRDRSNVAANEIDQASLVSHSMSNFQQDEVGRHMQTSLEVKLSQLQTLNAQLTAVNEKLTGELKRRDETIHRMREERRYMLESKNAIDEVLGQCQQSEAAERVASLRGEVQRQSNSISSLQTEITKMNAKHKQTCRVLVERMAVEMSKRDSRIRRIEEEVSSPRSMGCVIADVDTSIISCGAQEHCGPVESVFPHFPILDALMNTLWGEHTNNADMHNFPSLERVLLRISCKPQRFDIGRLELSNQHIGDIEIAELVSAMVTPKPPSIDTLILDGNRIGWRGAGKLADLLQSKHCVLSTLDLRWNQIGETGAASLASSIEFKETLVNLDLCANGIGPGGSAALGNALRHNQTLERLSLSGNQIRDIGLVKLAKGIASSNCALLCLDVADNQIGVVGIAALADAMVANSHMTSLNCGHNPGVGEQGGLALATILASERCSLTSLSANDMKCGDGAFSEIAHAIDLNRHNQLTELNLGDNNAGHEGGLALAHALSFGHNKTLRRLCLDGNVGLGQHAVLALCKSPCLYDLSLQRVDLSEPKDAMPLADLLTTSATESLQILDLKDTGIDDSIKEKLIHARNNRTLLLTIKL